MTLMTSDQGGGFDELASGSLPSLGGNPLQPSWSRSLQELIASNQALLGGNPQQPTAAAQVLLGDRTDFSTLAASTPKQPKPTEVFCSMQERCRKYRDGTIERILQRERDQTQKTQQKALEQQQEDDWARESEWWRKEIVGTRNLVDSANGLSTRPPEQQLMLVGSNLQGLSVSPHNFLGDPRSSRATPLDAKMANDHLQVVKSITPSSNSSSSNSNNNNLAQIISKFQKICTSDSNQGYITAWQLLSTLIPNLTTPINGALGSLIHFCRQYQTVVKNRVASARLAGQDVSTTQYYGVGMGGTIAAYVKLEFGSMASIWHILYICLRCGDAVAAKNVMDVASAARDNFPELPMVSNVILQMCQRQGNATCIWENGVPMISSRDRDALVDAYEKAQNLEPNNTHKIGALALLSGNHLASFNTIEDYLFGRLWLALQHEDPESEIKSIGESIRQYGPEYFGGEESGGWGYALPLLASQQLKTALIFLAEAGGSTGVLQAVHLGLAFSISGTAVGDLGHQSSSGCLVTALLVKYATMLEAESSMGPLAALEYLLRIPKKDRSRQEISALVARSHRLADHLAGVLNEDGGRQNGELDKHLPTHEVSMILAESAEIFRRQSHDTAKAEMSARLFMLAGRFGSLLTLLNELISPTNVDDEQRRYWCDQSQRVFDTYLSKRTLVLASLERENNLDLITTNRQLSELRKFFELLRNDRLYEAYEKFSGTGLLPLLQDDLNDRQSKYRDLHPILQKQFPDFVTGAVQCLYGLHRKVKSESRAVDPNVEARLKELQFKARLLYIFSGLVGMPSSTKEDIQKMRNHMI